MDRINPERLEEILDRIRRVRVLVVGDLMLDRYLRGGASRISPEAPVPVVRIDETWRAVGGAANVAANAAAIGASVEVVGLLGRDDAGSELAEELQTAGISIRGLCPDPTRPTTVKTRILVHHQQVARYDLESDASAAGALESQIIQRIDTLASDCDVIVLEDYNKGVLTPAVIRAALAAARRLGCPVVVDPKFRCFFDYQGATVFKPNQLELAAAFNEDVQADDPAWMESARERLQCNHLLVTLGEGGMSLMSDDAEFVRVPALARAVYDVSGAGDTVTAVLSAALASGASAAESAILANHAAAIEVTKPGVATVSPDELRQAVMQARSVGWRDAEPLGLL